MLKLSEITLLFIDTEFIRRDMHGGKFTPNIHGSNNIDLWTIQYSIFKLDDLKKNELPPLEILTRWEHKNEVNLLKSFFSTYKRLAYGTRAKTRLYPIGNMIYTDLEILCNKYKKNYHIFHERAKKEGFGNPRNLFSRYHMVFSSRYFDIKQFLMLEIGIIDPKQSSYFGHPDMSGYQVAENLVKIKKFSDKNNEKEELSETTEKVIKYIKDEFKSTIQIIKDLFCKYFNGIYEKENFKYKDILNLQDKRLKEERKKGRSTI